MRWTCGPWILAGLVACAGPTGDGDTSQDDSSDTSGEETGDGDGDGEPGPCDPPLEPVALENARLDADGEGRLRDALGRDVVMRGINTGGRNKWAPFLPFPIQDEDTVDDVRNAADVFFARLEDWGLDTVRLPFSWEALEPTQGEVDQTYLARYEAMVDAAWQHDLRVIVDFHQDIYASPFCGDGFPPWTLPVDVQGPPLHDCEDWFTKYLFDADVKQAFDDFWANTNGTQDQFEAMWALVVDALADHPGVVGFEIINEPGVGTAMGNTWKDEVLTPFHTKLAQQFHARAPDALVFFDNPGSDALFILPVLHRRPEGEDVVYAPHLYDLGLIAGDAFSGNDPEGPLEDITDFARGEHIPVLLGEFGYGMTAEDQGGPEWLDAAMDEVDRHRISATLWEYSINEELWNLEDLSVVDADGAERPILDTYVRPWLRALAGTDASFGWDHEAQVASVTWTAEDGVTEIVLPARLFDGKLAGIELSGSGACYTLDPDRGELRVKAPPQTAVTLDFSG